MSELTAASAADVLAACQAGAAEAAEAFGRALDGKITLTVGEAATYSAAKPPTGFEGPGLAVLLKFGDVGFAVILPEASGLTPAWYGAPDPTGESKLSTLAQELSMLLVPDSLVADHFEARRVEAAVAALTRAGAAADAALVTIEIAGGDKTGQLSLVWPLASPDRVFAAPAAKDEAAPAQEATPAAQAAGQASNGAPPPKPARRASSFAELPGYSRSLLRIDVPVSVQLAAKKEFVQEVVEIVPGSIIKFDKGCDQLLQMLVGGQLVAEGEAVKVGDKFGFRVTSMVLPNETFLPAKRPKAG